MVHNISNGVGKYEIILGMKDLASKGMATEVLEELNTLDPDFFTHNPTLFFQLKQVYISPDSYIELKNSI